MPGVHPPPYFPEGSAFSVSLRYKSCALLFSTTSALFCRRASRMFFAINRLRTLLQNCRGVGVLFLRSSRITLTSSRLRIPDGCHQTQMRRRNKRSGRLGKADRAPLRMTATLIAEERSRTGIPACPAFLDSRAISGVSQSGKNCEQIAQVGLVCGVTQKRRHAKDFLERPQRRSVRVMNRVL